MKRKGRGLKIQEKKKKFTDPAGRGGKKGQKRTWPKLRGGDFDSPAESDGSAGGGSRATKQNVPGLIDRDRVTKREGGTEKAKGHLDQLSRQVSLGGGPRLSMGGGSEWAQVLGRGGYVWLLALFDPLETRHKEST